MLWRDEHQRNNRALVSSGRFIVVGRDASYLAEQSTRHFAATRELAAAEA